MKNIFNISLAQAWSHINNGSLGYAMTHVILWKKHRFMYWSGIGCTFFEPLRHGVAEKNKDKTPCPSVAAVKGFVQPLSDQYRFSSYISYLPLFFRLLIRNLRMSSRNGKPITVPTTEPMTPVVRAKFPERPKRFTASISTSWADTAF